MEFAYEMSQLLEINYNKCLRNGTCPWCWKCSTVIALSKVSHVNSLGQLRPVALTPNFGKTLEGQWPLYPSLTFKPKSTISSLATWRAAPLRCTWSACWTPCWRVWANVCMFGPDVTHRFKKSIWQRRSQCGRDPAVPSWMQDLTTSLYNIFPKWQAPLH